jgi:hypothetical protein
MSPHPGMRVENMKETFPHLPQDFLKENVGKRRVISNILESMLDFNNCKTKLQNG